MDQPMKRGFKKSFVSYPDCKYKDLAYGTIYYVAGTNNTALNAYVQQHTSDIAEQINSLSDTWLNCQIVYLNADNPLFTSSENALLYSAVLPTKNHPEGYNFLMATLYTCDTESMNSVFNQYYDTLLKMLDDILERGSCHGWFVDEIDGKPVGIPDDIMFRIVPPPISEQAQLFRQSGKLSRLDIVPNTYQFLLPDYEERLCFTTQVKALYTLFLLHPEGIRMKDIGDYKEEYKRLYFRFSNRSNTDKMRESIERLFDLMTPNALNVKKSQCSKELKRVIPNDDARRHYEIEVHRSGPHRIRLDRKLVTIPESLL